MKTHLVTDLLGYQPFELMKILGSIMANRIEMRMRPYGSSQDIPLATKTLSFLLLLFGFLSFAERKGDCYLEASEKDLWSSFILL